MVNSYGGMQRRNFAHLQECTQYQTTQDKCLHAVNYNTPVPSSTAYTFTTLYKSSSRRILPHVMLWLAGSPLNMMWSTVQRCASSESCLGHERIYKIPRLHCHGSCHFGSPLLNESAIQFPHGDNWTTAFLLSVPLNLPTSALLLPLRRTYYCSACPGSNPASTYKIFWARLRSAGLGHAAQSRDVEEILSSQPLITRSAGYGYTFSNGIPNSVLEKFRKCTPSQEIVDWKLHSKCCECVCLSLSVPLIARLFPYGQACLAFQDDWVGLYASLDEDQSESEFYEMLKGFWGCIWQGVHVKEIQ